MEADVLKAVSELGVPFAVIVVLVVFILKREASFLSVVARLADLVENNTKAMVSLADLARENGQALAAHDGRSCKANDTVSQVYDLVKDIDAKVSQLLTLVRGVVS